MCVRHCPCFWFCTDTRRLRDSDPRYWECMLLHLCIGSCSWEKNLNFKSEKFLAVGWCNLRVSYEKLRFFGFTRSTINRPSTRVAFRTKQIFFCWYFCYRRKRRHRSCRRCLNTKIFFSLKFLKISEFLNFELTSTGTPSVCDTKMLRHTMAINVTRHNWDNLDIIPGNFFQKTNEKN